MTKGVKPAQIITLDNRPGDELPVNPRPGASSGFYEACTMLNAPLTERQSEILLHLVAYSDMHGYPPTIREIGNHFGISSPNGVVSHLKALRDKGAIDWRKGQSRTLKVRSVPLG